MTRLIAFLLAGLFLAGHACAQGLAPLSGPNLSELPPSAPQPKEIKPIDAAAVPARPATPAAATDQVWVNTAQKVYYCPGSQAYGRSAPGEFMREGSARSLGVQPAQGRGCRG